MSGGATAPLALGRAAARISGWTAASRAGGVLRVVVVTAVLGTTYLGNTYQSANTVPNVLFELFAAGALHAVLVPTLVDALDDRGPGEAERVAGGILGAALVGLAVVTVAAMAASPLVMRLLVAGVDDPAVRDAQVRLGTVLLLLLLPQVLCYGVGLVATGLLHANQRFGPPAAAPLANNAVVIGVYGLFWLLVRDPSGWPATPLTPGEVLLLGLGTTLGVVAMTAVPVVALRRHGLRLRPRWLPAEPRVRRLARHGGWAVGQVVAAQVLLVVVLVVANGTEGGVVAFQLALTFVLVPVALVAVPVATAVSPTLARLAAEPAAFARLAGRSVLATVALLAPAAAALTALAWPVVRVVAFGQAAAAGLGTLAHALMALAPGLVGYGVVLVLTRASYARGDARTPALVLAAVLGVGALAMVVVSPHVAAADRVTVLAALHSAAYLAAAVALWWALDRRLGGDHLGVAGRVAGVLGAAVVAGLVMGGLAAAAGVTGRLASLAVAVGAGLAGLVVDAALVRAQGLRPARLVRLDADG